MTLLWWQRLCWGQNLVFHFIVKRSALFGTQIFRGENILTVNILSGSNSNNNNISILYSVFNKDQSAVQLNKSNAKKPEKQNNKGLMTRLTEK